MGQHALSGIVTFPHRMSCSASSTLKVGFRHTVLGLIILLIY
jgi:hypothetical protein